MSKIVLPAARLASVATAALILVAAPAALAQQRPGETMGLRYLSWNGKAAAPTANAAVAADGLRRPGPMVAGGSPYPSIASGDVGAPSNAGRPNRYGPTPNPYATASNTLTPASAWLQPRQPQMQAQPQVQAAPQMAMPAYAAQPQYQAAPQMQAPMPQVQAQYQPQYQPQAQPQMAWPQQQQAQPQPQMMAAAPVMQPQPQPIVVQPTYSVPANAQPQVATAPQPIYAAPAYASAQPAPNAAQPVMQEPYDPMAPRRDALIYTVAGAQPPAAQPMAASQAQQPQVQQPQAQAQPAPNRPTVMASNDPHPGPRYYSLHRDAGHEPDPLQMPEQVYLNGLASAPSAASQDLAEPPAAPVAVRGANGRTRTIVPNEEPSLP